MQNLYGKFIRVQVIKDAKNDMKAVNYEHANQLPGERFNKHKYLFLYNRLFYSYWVHNKDKNSQILG
jgi:hypothetical protein